MRKSTHGFPLLLHDAYGAPLGGPLGRPAELQHLNLYKREEVLPELK